MLMARLAKYSIFLKKLENIFLNKIVNFSNNLEKNK